MTYTIDHAGTITIIAPRAPSAGLPASVRRAAAAAAAAAVAHDAN